MRSGIREFERFSERNGPYRARRCRRFRVLRTEFANAGSEYLNYLKYNLEIFFKLALANRDSTMDTAKIPHDRQIKKFDYDIKDLVLYDHSQLKKGLSSGNIIE